LAALGEAGAGLVLFFGYLWWILPAYAKWPHVLAAVAFIGLLSYSRLSRRETWHGIGLRRENFLASAKTVLPVTAAAAVAATILWSLCFPLTFDFFAEWTFWVKLFTYPLWALLQQYILLAFLFRRLREGLGPNPQPAIWTCALVFAAAHLPTPPLMIGCFLGALFWCWAYHRKPNLYTLALSHAIMAVLFSSVLGAYMKVGPLADPGRWTEQGPVHYSLDRVCGIVPMQHAGPIVIAAAQLEAFTVSGWVVPLQGKLAWVGVRIDGEEFKAQYGLPRPDVAAHFDRPDYRNVGFRCRISVKQLEPGYHRLWLKVRLQDRHLSHYPSKRVWIQVQGPDSDYKTAS
jgi:membrane protease YdiL (CAAX protease family)